MNRNDELEKLRKENKKLKKKIKGLEATIKITTQHGDTTTEKLEQKMSASEEQYRRILDVMPISVVIIVQTGGRILHVNRRACETFGYPYEEYLKKLAPSLYKDPEDREKFINIMEQNGKVDEFEVQMKRSDGSFFWVSLSSEPIIFQDNPCNLCVIYDLTERKRTEEKIRKLQEQLDNKEEKYLAFILAGEEYGIHISNVSEIIGIMPVISLPEISDYVKGVINLRGKVIPVVDLRLRLCPEDGEFTEQSCIIVVDIKEKKMKKIIGLTVDAVSEILNIRGKDIEAPPDFGPFAGISFISGIAKSQGAVKILLDVKTLLEDIGTYE